MTPTPARQPYRCHTCGAEMSHTNPEVCKNFHVQQATHTSTPAPEVRIYPVDQDPATWQRYIEGQRDYAAKDAREHVLKAFAAHFRSFEDQKSFRYSASEIAQYADDFRERESLRQPEPRQQEGVSEI